MDIRQKINMYNGNVRFYLQNVNISTHRYLFHVKSLCFVIFFSIFVNFDNFSNYTIESTYKREIATHKAMVLRLQGGGGLACAK